MQLFGIIPETAQRRLRFRRGLGSEKSNEQLTRLYLAAAREGVAGDRLSQFVRRAKDDLRTKFKFALDRVLNFLRNLRRVFLFRPEQNVPTLHIATRVREFERFVESPQGIHFDSVVCPHIHAAEHRDQHAHIPFLFTQARRHNIRIGYTPHRSDHALLVGLNQEKHFEFWPHSPRIGGSTAHVARAAPSSRADLLSQAFRPVSGPSGEVPMSGQVVLYFEDQADALRFALAAGSVMAGDGEKFTSDLVEETTRATRIRLDAVNAGNIKKTNS